MHMINMQSIYKFIFVMLCKIQVTQFLKNMNYIFSFLLYTLEDLKWDIFYILFFNFFIFIIYNKYKNET